MMEFDEETERETEVGFNYHKRIRANKKLKWK